MEKIVRCYNCGKELKPGEATKEHIPAKTLFEGYDEKYKENRITVPACFECNNNYSLTDEEFRNMIGVIAKRNENVGITHKAVKSILRKDPEHKRLFFDPLRDVFGVDFCMQQFVDFNAKNFKGLFYHQYGFPLPDNYKLRVITKYDENPLLISEMLSYLKCFEWKCSGNKSVFSYCIQPYRLGVRVVNKKDLELKNEDNIVVGSLVYNQEIDALVLALKKAYLDEIRDGNGE